MPLVAGLIQSLLMFLAFEPVAWWPVALAAPLPGLLLATRAAGLGWKPAAAFAAGTIPFWLWHHLFIMDITGPGFVPLVLYLSAWPGLAVWALARVRGAWPRVPLVLAAPLLWTGLDMLRGEILLTGYAWFLPGQPLIDSPFATAGGAVGIYGVGVLVLAFAAALAALVRRPRSPSGAVGLVASPSLLALAMMAGDVYNSDDPSVRVAIVQTNVPQSNKLAWTPERAAADYGRLLELTQAAAAAGPALIVWPETMKFGWVLTDAQIAETEALLLRHPEYKGLRDHIRTAEMAREVSRRVPCPILVGQETYENLDFVPKNGRTAMTYSARYNSSYLMDGGNVADERYDKLEPTPFGENIPWASHWPWLRDKLTDLAAGGMKIDLASGTRRTVFSARGLRAVTPICFESTDTALCRSLVYEAGRRRADVIACMTNDGWFGDSRSGRRQHLQLARWRCVELGTPMIRAANTGLSAFIDGNGGRVLPTEEGAGPGALGPTPFQKDGFLIGTIQTPSSPTLYGKFGNVAGWGALAASALLFLGTFHRKHERGPAPNTPLTPGGSA